MIHTIVVEIPDSYEPNLDWVEDTFTRMLESTFGAKVTQYHYEQITSTEEDLTMTDREMLNKLREYLAYEQDVTPEMVDAEDQSAYRLALQRQIGTAWEMASDHLKVNS